MVNGVFRAPCIALCRKMARDLRGRDAIPKKARLSGKCIYHIVYYRKCHKTSNAPAAKISVVFLERNVAHRQLPSPSGRLDSECSRCRFFAGRSGELGSRSNSGAAPATVVERKPRQKATGHCPGRRRARPSGRSRARKPALKRNDRNWLRRAAGSEPRRTASLRRGSCPACPKQG